MAEKDPDILSSDEIEEIEKLTLRWIFQAVRDFGTEACEIFLKSPDSVKDIAEDITRELLDRLPGFKESLIKSDFPAAPGCAAKINDDKLLIL